MTLEYSEGNPVSIELGGNKDVEVIGGKIVEGTNKVAIAFKDYKNVGYVTVEGKRAESSEDSNNNMDSTIEPETMPVDNPEVTPTTIENTQLQNESLTNNDVSEDNKQSSGNNGQTGIIILLFVIGGLAVLSVCFFVIKKPFGPADIKNWFGGKKE